MADIPIIQQQQQAQDPYLKALNAGKVTPSSSSPYSYATTSPAVREEAGFFVNPLESLLSVFGVPQQLLYTFGKNLGEVISGEELTDQGFLDDLYDAVSGRGRLSFNDVLKSVGAENLDLALPEGMTIDNWMLRVPASVAAGILTSFVATPFAGIATGFALNDLMAGKGAVSSFMDVVADPANKLRLFQKTAKGLGLSAKEFSEHAAKGTLESFAREVGKARKLDGTVLKQLIKGERALFDFKGSSGLLKMPTAATVDGMIIPITREYFDLGRWVGVNVFADTLNAGTHATGQFIRKLPGVGVLSKFDDAFLSKITTPIARNLSTLTREIFQVGGKEANIFQKTMNDLTEAGLDVGERDEVYKLSRELQELWLSGKLKESAIDNEVSKRIDSIMRFEDAVTKEKINNITKDMVISDWARKLNGVHDKEWLFTHSKQSEDIKQSVEHYTQQQDILGKVRGGLILNAEEDEYLKSLGFKPILHQEGALDAYTALKNKQDVINLLDGEIKANMDVMKEMDKTVFELDTAVTKSKKAVEVLEKNNAADYVITTEKEKLAQLKGQLDAEIRKYDNVAEITAADKSFTVRAGNEEVLKTTREALKYFHPKVRENIVFLWDKSLVGKQIPKSNSEFITAQAMIKTIKNPKSRDNTTKMFINLYGLHDNGSIGNLLAEAAWNASTDDLKNAFMRTVEATDPLDAFKKFKDTIRAGFMGNPLHPSPEKQQALSGFVDYTRNLVGFFGDMINPKAFKDKNSQKAVFDFLNGNNFLAGKTKALDKVTFNDVKKLLNDDGTIVDPFRVKNFMDNSRVQLQNSKLLSQNSGIRADLYGVAWEPTDPLLKKAHERLVQQTAGLVMDIEQRGQIGNVGARSFQTMIRESPEYQKLITDNQILSPEELKSFLSASDLTYMDVPGSSVRDSMIKIMSSLQVVPYDHFDSTLSKLFYGIADQTKNAAYVPATEFLLQNATFYTQASAKARAADLLFDTLDTVYMDPQKFSEVANFFNKWKAFMPNAKKAQAAQNAWLQPKSVSNYKMAMGLTEELLETGMPEGAFKELSDIYNSVKGFQEFMPRDELLGAISAYEKAFIAPDKKVKDLVKRLTAGGKEGLSKGEKQSAKDIIRDIIFPEGKTFQEGITESSIVKGIQDMPGAFYDIPLKKLAAPGQEVGEEVLSKLGGMSKYEFDKAGGKTANALQAMMSGQYVPAPIKDLLIKPPQNLPENFSGMQKFLLNLVKGAEEEDAQKYASRTIGFLKSFLPDTAVKSKEFLDKGTDLAQRFYQSANYDYVTNLFKSQALLSSAFHARNSISAFWTNMHFGVAMDDYSKAFKSLRTAKRVQPGTVFTEIDNAGRMKFKINPSANLSKADEFYMKRFMEMESQGLLSGGQAQELRRDIGSRRGVSWNPLSLTFRGYNANFRVAGGVEDWVRSSAYNHARDTLKMSMQDSAGYAKMLHFDYNNLTDIEVGLFKRIVPFYTYWRKAITRDSRMFMQRTGEYVKLGHLVHEAEKGVPPEESDALSNYIKEQLGVNISVDEEGRHSYVLLGGLIPAADLMSKLVGPIPKEKRMQPTAYLKQVAKSFLEGMNPILKLPVESPITPVIGINWNFYFGKPVEEYAGEQTDYGGTTFPTRYVHLFQTVRLLNDLDKVARAFRTMPFEARPDIPLPSRDPKYQAQELFSVLGGVKIKENANPAVTKYFNNLEKTAEGRHLMRRYRKEVRRGPENVNIPVLQKNISEQEEQKIEALRKKEEARALLLRR